MTTTCLASLAKSSGCRTSTAPRPHGHLQPAAGIDALYVGDVRRAWDAFLDLRRHEIVPREREDRIAEPFQPDRRVVPVAIWPPQTEPEPWAGKIRH